MNDRAPGVRVRVRRTNLNDGYLIVPNDLLRGSGIYAGLSGYARLLLGAGLSCQQDWETTMEDIESWLEELGRNRQEAVRRELREHGFLSMSRQRIPKGQPNGGQYIWTLEFLMDPLPADQRDELPAKKARGKKGSAMPRNPGHGDEEHSGGKTPGGTTPGFSGHGEPGHGEPGPGDRGDVYKEEKNHLEKNSPPTPQDSTTPDPGDAATGGGETPEEEQTRLLLQAGVDKALKLKPRWTKRQVWAAVNAALQDGHQPKLVAEAIAIAADDRTTLQPSRILNGMWWDDNMARREQEQRPAEPCEKYGHGYSPKHNCGACRGENLERISA